MTENTCIQFTDVVYIHVHPKFWGTFPGSSNVFYRVAIVLCPCCSYSQLKPVWLTSFKSVALSLSTLTAGFRWFSRIRPYWKQTPASLRGAHLLLNHDCWRPICVLKLISFDFVASAIDVCLSLDVICSSVSIDLAVMVTWFLPSQAYLDRLRGQGTLQQWMLPLSS